MPPDDGNNDHDAYERTHESPPPAGVFPDLRTVRLPMRFDPRTMCMLCFGPLAFRLCDGSAAGADVCADCTTALARAEGLTIAHLRRHVAALFLRFGIPIPAMDMRPAGQ